MRLIWKSVLIFPKIIANEERFITIIINFVFMCTLIKQFWLISDY